MAAAFEQPRGIAFRQSDLVFGASCAIEHVLIFMARMGRACEKAPIPAFLLHFLPLQRQPSIPGLHPDCNNSTFASHCYSAGSVNSSTDFESKEDTPRSSLTTSSEVKFSPREVLSQIKTHNSDISLIETACKRLASLAAKNEGAKCPAS